MTHVVCHWRSGQQLMDVCFRPQAEVHKKAHRSGLPGSGCRYAFRRSLRPTRPRPRRAREVGSGTNKLAVTDHPVLSTVVNVGYVPCCFGLCIGTNGSGRCYCLLCCCVSIRFLIQTYGTFSCLASILALHRLGPNCVGRSSSKTMIICVHGPGLVLARPTCEHSRCLCSV